MMGLSDNIGEVVPFTVMVIMEGCTIGLTIMAKTAMSGGMSPFVFLVYTNALGVIILLPHSFMFHRDRVNLPLFLRFFFLGLTGMTKLDWSNSSFQFKVLGTLVSAIGAVVVELCIGPNIRKVSSPSLNLVQKQQLFVFYSTPDHWVLGGLLLAAASLCNSIWNVIQLGTIKQYPQVMKIASFYCLAGTIQCAIFSLIVERDLNAWKLKLNMDLLLIVLTAIFWSVIRSSVHVCFSRMKGPFYVPLLQPFRVFWSTFFGVSFFANSLHYGRIKTNVISLRENVVGSVDI